MPFQFEGYRSPYAGTIAKLLQKQGEIPAQAEMQRGQIRANAAQSIGAMAGEIPRQIQQQQVQQRKQVDMERVQKARDAFATALKETPFSMVDGMPMMDTQAILEKGKAAGFGPEFLSAMPQVAQVNQSIAQAASARKAAVVMAAKAVIAGGSHPDMANVVLDQIDQAKLYPDSYIQEFKKALKEPGNVEPVMRFIIGPMEPDIRRPGDVPTDKLTNQPIGPQVPALPQNPTEASLAADAANPQSATQKRSATALASLKPVKAPDVGSFEDYVVRRFGQNPTPEQITQARKDYGQADDRIPRVTVNTSAPDKSLPGNWDLSGPAFLETIPAQWRTTVKKIAQYDEDPTKVASMRGGMREALTQWVNQVNPAYDQAQFAIRNPTKKAFTTGTQGQQINAINTAIGHIDQLTGLAEQLQSGGFVPGNRAWNTMRSMFGSDKVTNFDTLKDALAGEVSSVLSKGSATVSGIADAKEKIHAASSPQQLAGYVKTLIPVMGSKLKELNYQYHQAMGENDPFSTLSPESIKILQKHGVDLSSVVSGSNAGDILYDSNGQRISK